MLPKQRIRPLSHSDNAKHIDLAVPNQRRLSISLARTQVEIEEAQRLRYKVFAEEMGYYSAGEFDLSRLSHLFDRTVEVGRACVHQNYRNGGTITMLWAGLAKYMQIHNYEYMIGCGSVSMYDGGHAAASLYTKLADDYLSPLEYRVFPRNPLLNPALRTDMQVACPPLIKGYLRLGAYICGEPAWDPYFNTADMLVMLPLSKINPRYAAHFLK
jgi:putative hemolysin